MPAHPNFRRYNPELTAQWTREISDEIKNKLKSDLELPRYKFVVQVVVGEQRGEGVRMGCRCFWDADTDNYAEESYRNVRSCCRGRLLPLAASSCVSTPPPHTLPRPTRRAPRHLSAHANLEQQPCFLTHANSPSAPARASASAQDSLFCVAAVFGAYLY